MNTPFSCKRDFLIDSISAFYSVLSLIPDERKNIFLDIFHFNLETLDVFDVTHFLLLSKNEIKKSRKFQFCTDAMIYIKTRIIVRLILGKYTGENPQRIEFKTNKYGRPSISNFSSNIDFNISHSKTYLMCGLSNEYQLGVDLEIIAQEPGRLKAAHVIFSKSEIDDLKKSDDSYEVFYKYWVQKEAIIKSLGSGLSKKTKDIEIIRNNCDSSYGKYKKYSVHYYRVWECCIACIAILSDLSRNRLY